MSGAELLRLGEGAARQRLAGDAGREAQIVLDARAGAGLAAEGAGVDDRDRETFGRSVDRSREPRRPAADDGDIVDTVVLGPTDHADGAAELGLAGIAQHRAAGRDDERPILRLRRIARDQFGGVMLALGVEQMMRLAIAGEKALQAHHAGGVRGPDQHGAADAALDQIDPAQDQRAHDALAKLGFGHQQRAQPVRRDEQHLDIAFGAAVDQRRPARELAELGQELPRPLIDHRRDVTETVALGDGDVARQHHEHAGPGLAGLEQQLAVRVGADFAEVPDPFDLGGRQRRKGLLGAGEPQQLRITVGSLCFVLPHGHCMHSKISSRRRSTRGLAGGPLIWGTIVVLRGVGACGAFARLHLPPLQVFAQRRFQPVVPGRPRLPRALVSLVAHRGSITATGHRMPSKCGSSRG
ncbi:hypothetical protein ABIA40_005495 [Bradyrhizobium sp. USDA 223]